jgi:hypothetical protein
MGDAMASSRTNTEDLDMSLSLHALGFKIKEVSPWRLTGHFVVTPTCSQIFFLATTKNLSICTTIDHQNATDHELSCV